MNTTMQNTATQTANTLFLSLDTPDRSKTQIAYAANYFPARELTDAAARLVVWSRKVMLYKAQILNLVNEDMTFISYTPKGKERIENKVGKQEWAIHWAFNAIPTQIEWERKSAGFIIECNFRVIADGTKIVLLNF